MKAKRRSKAQKLCPDRISTLPQTIIEIILCLVPIKDAARTSILSTEWRYKWTTISKLVFDHSVLPRIETEEQRKVQSTSSWSRRASLRREMDSMPKLFYAIYQVLLLRQGPIHEFTLSTGADFSCFEIDQIILHLSRNHTVQKLKLVFQYDDRYKLPLSIFSMNHLTDLHLEYCDLEHKPTFSGLGSLKSLYLKYGTIPTETLLHFLSNSPALKSFTLFLEKWEFGREEYCTSTELFECLPELEHLATWSVIIGWLVVDSTPKELPTLIHLKYFSFEEMCLKCCEGLTFIAVLLKCSPNLKKIKFKTYFLEVDHQCSEDEVISNVLEEYSDVWLEHLNELEIECLWYDTVKSGLEFVKFILARSPKLEKVSIRSGLHKDQEFDMLKDLLAAPRVSPVKIVVHSHGEKKPFRSIKFPKYQ